MPRTIWLGGQKCDFCGFDMSSSPPGTELYDASTPQGWGVLCTSCFTIQGCKLGTGCGQKYMRDGSLSKPGRFIKLEG